MVRARCRGEEGMELMRYGRETVKDRAAGSESGTPHIASETVCVRMPVERQHLTSFLMGVILNSK